MDLEMEFQDYSRAFGAWMKAQKQHDPLSNKRVQMTIGNIHWEFHEYDHIFI